MDDLEMTRLCAEGMGGFLDDSGYLTFTLPDVDTPEFKMIGCTSSPYLEAYNPLHDDAQAMALLKRFNLMVNWNSPTEVWCMPMDQTKYGHLSDSPNCSDLNRAICECVANLQSSPTAPPQ